MKTIVNSEESVFPPVTLKITFESELEIQRFYAIFNSPAIAAGINFGDESDGIRKCLTGYGNVQVYSDLQEHLKKFYTGRVGD